jgi:hypothetical protein
LSASSGAWSKADGGFGETSIDFGEVDERGKLTKIVGFFGEAPRR